MSWRRQSRLWGSTADRASYMSVGCIYVPPFAASMAPDTQCHVFAFRLDLNSCSVYRTGLTDVLGMHGSFENHRFPPSLHEASRRRTAARSLRNSLQNTPLGFSQNCLMLLGSGAVCTATCERSSSNSSTPLSLATHKPSGLSCA